MQIFVQTLIGMRFTLEVGASYPVRYVKAKILDKIGIGIELQELKWTDQAASSYAVTMENEYLLSDYNIQHNSVLHMAPVKLTKG